MTDAEHVRDLFGRLAEAMNYNVHLQPGDAVAIPGPSPVVKVFDWSLSTSTLPPHFAWPLLSSVPQRAHDGRDASNREKQ